MAIESSGNSMVKSQADQQMDAEQEHARLVEESAGSKQDAAKAVSTAGSAADIVGMGSKALSSAPVVGGFFSALSVGCDVAGAACDVSAGTLNGVAAAETGDELGAASSFTSAAGGAVNYGINESGDKDGFLDAKSKTLEAAADADAAGSAEK